MSAELTPCSALFAAMKKLGGISYKELAGLILSGRPLSDGRSPVSRINDRTWVSRFVVHAPVGSLQERYFCDFGVSALRIVARLKAKSGRCLTSEQILDLIRAEDTHGMEHALGLCHQNMALYRNTLERIVQGPGFTFDERAETAMVLFVSCGCLADVRKGVERTMQFAQSVNAGRLTTPAVRSDAPVDSSELAFENRSVLGLLRVVNGYVVGAPYWLEPGVEGIELGALALSEGAINDVGPHVSARHARIWRTAEGIWFVEDLGSSNGTYVVSGATGEHMLVAAPEAQRAENARSTKVRIRPGDELHLADDTVFVIMEGVAG